MKSNRRGFLKSGATLAGGLTLGAVAPAIGQAQQGIGPTPGSGQTAGPEKFIKAGKELVAYWNRYSRPEKTAKYSPVAFDTWWFDEAKDRALQGKQSQ